MCETRTFCPVARSAKQTEAVFAALLYKVNMSGCVVSKRSRPDVSRNLPLGQQRTRSLQVNSPASIRASLNC